MNNMSDAKTDLNQLVIFAKVVDTRSFTAAGRELGLPKSTVSRKVAQLEQRLGVRLLRRTTRKLSLTEVGAAFYERCARISIEIQEAEEAVASVHDKPRGLLRVALPREIGSALINGPLNDFLRAYREIDIELSLRSGEPKLAQEGYDIALQLGEIEPAGPGTLIAELGSLRTQLIASAEYLERAGVPSTPAELEHHELALLAPYDPVAGLLLAGPEDEPRAIKRRPRLVSNELAVVRSAVEAGNGIGLLPTFVCADLLESGRARVVLPEWGSAEISVYARYPTSRHLSAKVRALIEFLSERFVPLAWPSRAVTRSPALHESPRPVAQGA